MRFCKLLQDSYAFLVCLDFSTYNVSDAHTIWFFDNGASRHITSRKDLFSLLGATSIGRKVTCATNSSYPIQGINDILINVVNGSNLCLSNVLYVLGIKKNWLSISSLSKNGYHIIF